VLLPEESADIELGGMDCAVRGAKPNGGVQDRFLSAIGFSLHLKTGL
jgi:hypothetical protein